MQNSLRFRLIAILIGLAIGPLLLAGIVLVQRSFAFEQAQAFNLQKQVAQNVSNEVTTFFLEITTDLNSLGDEIRNLGTADRAQQLSLMLSAISSGSFRDAYNELTLLNPDGHEVVRLSANEIVPDAQLIDRSQKDEFKQPKATRTIYYSPVVIDQSTGKAFITIAIPLYESRSTNLIGVLIANIRLDAIGNVISAVQAGDNQTIYLTDANGDVLAHQDRTKDLKGLQIQLPKSAARQNGLNGSDAILAPNTVTLGDQSIFIVAEKPSKVALEFAYTTTNTIVFIVILALIAAVILGFLAVRQIVVPIEGLASIANRVASGELTQKVPLNRRDEIGVLAAAFNSMTSQLLDLVGSLEQRVKDRTTELAKANESIEHRAVQFESISQVARTISSTRGLDSLLIQITEVISREFNFYHTGIFLLDSSREYAVLSASNSDGGRRMLERSHRLKVGETGIVGYVTSTGRPRVALDTGTDAVFFNNPDLPETRSEIALPLHIGDQIIGALDVQSTEPNAFNQEDLSILSTLADQVSIAIQNARQYEETRKALTESEALSKQFIQTGWSRFTRSSSLDGIYHTGSKSTLLYRKNGNGRDKDDSEKIQLKTQGRGAILSLPVKLRGEVIGSVDVRSPENREWDQDELEVVTAILERSAIAMENARLLAESQNLAAKERTIGEISTKISAQSDVGELLKVAAQELGRALPGMDIAVQLNADRETDNA
jgi:GAF domain-containing protein/HAMP domain-containing protein